MKEDIDHLTQWIDEVLLAIEDLNAKKGSSDILVFMIGNTSQDIGSGRPYLTPVRKLSNGFVFGSIVYSQTQAIFLSTKIDGLVDYIFVDSEKKLPINKNPDHSPFDYFGISDLNLNKNKMVEYGNISSVCSNTIQSSHMFAYKGNDISADTAWLFLIEKFRELSGKKVLIYGAGNIGNKLALKLVECGCTVIIVTRNIAKTESIVKSLNKIKSTSVLSSITASTEPEISSKDIDAIIGCTNAQPVITESMVANMNLEGVVIDIGKGTIFQDAIDFCNKKNMEIWRLDITAIINSLIASSRSMQNLLKSSFGRREIIENTFVVSGGFIGSRYDIIGDSYLTPKAIIGVCEGPGKIFFDLDDIAQKKLESVEKLIKSNNQK